jgi:hypothetical protein
MNDPKPAPADSLVTTTEAQVLYALSNTFTEYIAKYWSNAHVHLILDFSDLEACVGTKYAFIVARAARFRRDPAQPRNWVRKYRGFVDGEPDFLDVDDFYADMQIAIKAIDPLGVLRPLLKGAELPL